MFESQNAYFAILQNDTLFQHSQECLTLTEQRELTFKRAKRLHEYDAALKKFPRNSLKAMWGTEVITAYGHSVGPKKGLNIDVSLKFLFLFITYIIHHYFVHFHVGKGVVHNRA